MWVGEVQRFDAVQSFELVEEYSNRNRRSQPQNGLPNLNQNGPLDPNARPIFIVNHGTINFLPNGSRRSVSANRDEQEQTCCACVKEWIRIITPIASFALQLINTFTRR